MKFNPLLALKLKSKTHWTKDFDKILEKSRDLKPYHFDDILIDMLVWYNIEQFDSPYNTLILFNDGRLVPTKQETEELIQLWNDQTGNLVTLLQHTSHKIIGNTKKRPQTVGYYSFQRFDDQVATNHYVALHNIEDFYRNIKKKGEVWIESPDDYRIALSLKLSYLQDKMDVYNDQSSYYRPLFEQLAFYSRPSYRKKIGTHLVEENQNIQPRYTAIGRLDSLYTLFENVDSHKFVKDLKKYKRKPRM